MKQFVLFGLGNPGGEFRYTRHNLGADILLLWIEDMRAQGAIVSDWKTHEKFHARVCEITYNDTKIVVLSPLVFMNESGKVLASYLRYHPVDRENILIVHDDLEVSLGEVKFQASGSAHGHNGVRSIHEYLGDTNVPQLRIGIGRPFAKASGHTAPQGEMPIDKFVLSTFTPEEKEVLREKEKSILEGVTRVVMPDLPRSVFT